MTTRFAAVACGAQFIITRNVRDFKGSPVPAMTPEAFIEQHMLATDMRSAPASARRQKPRAT